jgi:hypothetical protein
MPAGPTTLGFVYFAGVKLAGYTAAGCALNWLYGRHSRQPPLVFNVEGVEAAGKRIAHANPFVFGVARTVLGVLGGFAVFALSAIVPGDDRLFYVVLAPVRYLEWLLIIWWFYGRASPGIARLLVYSLLGGLWSCVLDLPAVAAVFLLPRGCWIC